MVSKGSRGSSSSVWMLWRQRSIFPVAVGERVKKFSFLSQGGSVMSQPSAMRSVAIRTGSVVSKVKMFEMPDPSALNARF